MNRCVLAASAVVSMCGTSFGFQLAGFGQHVGYVAGPSSGLLRFETDNSGSSVYTANPWLLKATSTQWAAESAAILASSWIGIDAKGGPGNWTLGAGAANRPAYSDTNGNTSFPYIQTPITATAGFQNTGAGTATGINGGLAGWAVAPQRPGPISGIFSEATDLPEDIVGNDIDALQSIYLGHFAMTEADAILQGQFYVAMKTDAGVTIGSNEGNPFNLDGTLSFGFRLAQVRGPNDTIDLYFVEGVPAPGVPAVLGVGAAAGIRRRR